MKKVILLLMFLISVPLLAQENLASSRRDTATNTWKKCVMLPSTSKPFRLQVINEGGDSLYVAVRLQNATAGFISDNVHSVYLLANRYFVFPSVSTDTVYIYSNGTAFVKLIKY